MNDQHVQYFVDGRHGASGIVCTSPAGRVLLSERPLDPAVDVDALVDDLGEVAAVGQMVATSGALALIAPARSLPGTAVVLAGDVAATVTTATDKSFVRPVPGAVARHVVGDGVASVAVELGAQTPSVVAGDEATPWSLASQPARRLVVAAAPQKAAPLPPPMADQDARVKVLDLGPEPAEVPTPLPIDTLPPPAVGGAQVLGIRCPVGHHNHPDAQYCSSCGRRMGVNATAVLVIGPRPPVGLFLTDDGTAIPIAGDLLLGREPETHADVADGRRQGVLLPDDSSVISRHHLAVTLDGWDVAVSDLGSANGTSVKSASTGLDYRLQPGDAVTLESGDLLDLGPITLRLSLHHVA
ncbi:MAG: FHA domain-containing protein [Actinomycetota bacterium]